MKLKDALLSMAIAHYITTLPIWEVRDNMWLIGFMATFICWDVIIRIEEFWQKRKMRRRDGRPRSANKKIYYDLIIGDERGICQ